MDENIRHGARVVFFANPDNYTIREDNPLIGTTKEIIVGTVVSTRGGIFVVNWDNNTHNSYREGSLKLFPEDSYRKIIQEHKTKWNS